MNGCEQYRELISRLIDDELSADEKSALAQHLRGCDECAAMYVAFRQLSESVADQLVEPPAALRADVMAHIRRGEIRKKNLAPLKKVLAAAACVAVILLAASGIMPRIMNKSADVVIKSAPAQTFSQANSSADTAPVSTPVPAARTAEEEPAPTEPAVEAAPAATPAPTPVTTPEPQHTVDPGFTGTYVPDSAPSSNSNADTGADAVITEVPSAAGGGFSTSTDTTGSSLMSEEGPQRVDIDTHKRWTKLTTLLSGKESKFDPLAEDAKEADSQYLIVLLPEEKLELRVYLYEKELYYTLTDKTLPLDDAARISPKVYLAKCTPEEFLKFIKPQP